MANREQRRHFEEFVEGAVRPEDEPLNREQRRHPGRVPGDETPPHEDAPPHARPIERQGPPDVESGRAKSTGHGKKTADKWNQ